MMFRFELKPSDALWIVGFVFGCAVVGMVLTAFLLH